MARRASLGRLMQSFHRLAGRVFAPTHVCPCSNPCTIVQEGKGLLACRYLTVRRYTCVYARARAYSMTEMRGCLLVSRRAGRHRAWLVRAVRSCLKERRVAVEARPLVVRRQYARGMRAPDVENACLTRHLPLTHPACYPSSLSPSPSSKWEAIEGGRGACYNCRSGQLARDTGQDVMAPRKVWKPLLQGRAPLPGSGAAR